MEYRYHLNIISLRHCLRRAKQLWWSNKWVMLGFCIFLYALPEASGPMAIDGVFGSAIASFAADGFGTYAAYFLDDYIGYMTDGLIAALVITQLLSVEFSVRETLVRLAAVSVSVLIYAAIDFSIGSVMQEIQYAFLWIAFATFFYLAVPVMVIENVNVFKAMQRSFQLTKGNRFRFLLLASLYHGVLILLSIAIVLMEESGWYASLQLVYLDPVHEMARALILSFFAIVYAVIYFELQPYKDHVEDGHKIAAFD